MKTSCCHTKKIYKEKNYNVCMNPGCDHYMRPTDTYSTKRWNRVFLFSFAFFFFFLTYNDFSYDHQDKVKKIYLQKTQVSKPLTKENLLLELEANHIICPEQVYAQILIESGNLNSYLTKRTNNLLGMRYPYKRKSSAVGLFLPGENLIVKGEKSDLKKYKSQNNYAVYETWEDCIKDYKHWQESSFKLSEIYLKFLGSVYAEDPMYIAKIKQMTR